MLEAYIFDGFSLRTEGRLENIKDYLVNSPMKVRFHLNLIFVFKFAAEKLNDL
jgi:hypothetical protein